MQTAVPWVEKFILIYNTSIFLAIFEPGSTSKQENDTFSDESDPQSSLTRPDMGDSNLTKLSSTLERRASRHHTVEIPKLKKLQDFTTLSLHSIQTLSEVNRETKNLADEEKKRKCRKCRKRRDERQLHALSIELRSGQVNHEILMKARRTPYRHRYDAPHNCAGSLRMQTR